MITYRNIARILLVYFAFYINGAISAQQKMNVLFLVSDDMRPQLGSYLGEDFPDTVYPYPETHNLDALAAKSLLLKRAFVQQALCSPSRTSFLTGRRPDTTHVYDLLHYFRDVGGNFTTIPQYFKENGYRSFGIGKIFHPYNASNFDDPISWTEPYFHAPSYMDYKYLYNLTWKAVSKDKIQQKPLPDMEITEQCIHTLREVAEKAKTGEQPFFIATGFHKPHLPFNFPEEFLNYYPESSINIASNPFIPENLPEIAWFRCHGLENHTDMTVNLTFNGKLPDSKAIELRRAYYSAVTYVDSLVGRIMQELENLGLSNNTIISFIGDHGWQLGEHNIWCKQTNFDLATHAPMMIYIPGKTDRGIITEHLTEFVDLYPTLVEAAGLPHLPKCPFISTHIALCSEGESLMPLIENPATPFWKKRVFSQYPRNESKIMGYTMRSNEYRYTEWVKFDNETYIADWNDVVATELYDHTNDAYENINRANDINYSQITYELSKKLRAGWRYAMF